MYAVPFQSVNKLHLHASETILGAKLLTSFVKAGLRIIFEWWPDTTSKKFVLGQVLSLTSWNIKKKKQFACFKSFKKLLNRQNELKLNQGQPKICIGGFDRLFKKEIICHRSTWPVSDVFGRSSRHSRQKLSSGRPLFWAPKSVSFSSKRCFACTQPSSQVGLKLTSSPGALFFLSLGVAGKRELLEAGNEACLKPNFTTVAF